MIPRIFLAFLLFYFINGEAVDYKTMIENIHIEYFNDKLAAPNATFKFFKYNRTQFAINASIWVLEDLDGRDIEGLWQLTNCWPAASIKYFPKSVPQGSYKVTMESKLKDGRVLARIALYGKASLYFKDIQNMNNTSKYNIFQ
uniref:Uncharacterized protein LOC114334917 isoform X1 n=2 Tax=Diabrotica virgifera virgifera TaxID=50390 RepID=A0A6P7G8J9_DIAVI